MMKTTNTQNISRRTVFYSVPFEDESLLVGLKPIYDGRKIVGYSVAYRCNPIGQAKTVDEALKMGLQRMRKDLQARKKAGDRAREMLDDLTDNPVGVRRLKNYRLKID